MNSTLLTSSTQPILKGNKLDPTSSASYRPISSIPLLAKITEKIVQKQLRNYIDDHTPFDPLPTWLQKESWCENPDHIPSRLGNIIHPITQPRLSTNFPYKK